jgi:hypothetical protein
LDFQYKAASKLFVCGDNCQYFKPFESIVIFSNEHQKTMWYGGLLHKESIKDIQKYLIQVCNRLFRLLMSPFIVIYVDKCCQWQKQIFEVWPEALVKLDFSIG